MQPKLRNMEDHSIKNKRRSDLLRKKRKLAKIDILTHKMKILRLRLQRRPDICFRNSALKAVYQEYWIDFIFTGCFLYCENHSNNHFLHLKVKNSLLKKISMRETIQIVHASLELKPSLAAKG